MKTPTRDRTLLPIALSCFMVASLAGCLQDDPEPVVGLADLGYTGEPLHTPDLAWPDFSGRTLRILDHGAFFSFGTAAARFQELTGAKVTHVEADDTGSALNRAILDKGAPQADVIYGLDNVLLTRAIEAGILHPYTPQLAARVDPAYVFFGVAGDEPWPATPVDHGYIALNIDTAHDGLTGPVEDLFDVRDQAHLFVTQDPRTSTPGLGFLLTTIATFPDRAAYDWRGYWTELFENGVKVTSGWTEAYETHFSGGYGVWTDGHIGDRPIVTSYTESPAYEAYYGAEDVAQVLLAHDGRPAAFHQVQTMAILAGTDDLDLAQAWIEFTLTDEFQELAAPDNAVYPVVASVDTDVVYGDFDPEPGTFATVDLEWQEIGARLQAWIEDWTDLCEAYSCA